MVAARKRPGKLFLPGWVVLGPVNSGLWTVSIEASYERTGADLAAAAARHQDPQALATLYRDTKQIVLTIDGLLWEKGHETLYVVREVTQNRVWFAEPLLSGATDEIRKLFDRAKHTRGRAALISPSTFRVLCNIVFRYSVTPNMYHRTSDSPLGYIKDA